MNVEIVIPKEDDAQEISGFFREIFLELNYAFSEKAINSFINEHSVENIKKYLTNKSRLFLTAKENKKIIGTLHGYFYGGVFYVSWLAVNKQKRKKGIAKKLLNKLYYEVQKRNCHKISLISGTKLKLIDFYKKLGFKNEGILLKDWWQEDYYRLGKIIQVV